MRKLVFFLGIVFFLVGAVWLFYDITVPTFICSKINKTPKEVLGPLGVLKNVSLEEKLEKKFRYRVDIFNLSLDWREYKKTYGQEEYVYAYNSGGVTILTDDPGRAWNFFGKERRWARIIVKSTAGK